MSLSARIGAEARAGRPAAPRRERAAWRASWATSRSDPTGALCRCGNRGCLDTVASVDAVLDVLRPVHGAGLTLTGALELLAGGDPASTRVVADAGRAVGRMLAGVCNCLNPQAIVVGGELERAAGQPLLDCIRESIDRYAQPEIAAFVGGVEPGRLGKRASLLGALTAVIGEPYHAAQRGRCRLDRKDAGRRACAAAGYSAGCKVRQRQPQPGRRAGCPQAPCSCPPG